MASPLLTQLSSSPTTPQRCSTASAGPSLGVTGHKQSPSIPWPSGGMPTLIKKSQQAASASYLLLGCPSHCDLQMALANTCLLCQTPASAQQASGSETFQALSPWGTKGKGMNKLHLLLPGVAPGPLRLSFPIFFPLGHAEKNNFGPWGK